ncbi:hypothetical protein DFH11DRAFT_1274685 [Phellopilus nigrolimitatus]|nr:hypothetical protein DFH11DRAFT_1274685 [Phellopilus nigrolimitatus]
MPLRNLQANSSIERLRNECANLRAEKKIWESVQARLLDENKMLSVERSRMSDLMGNVQKMHNDIDRANESDRRRFESQIQALESQAICVPRCLVNVILSIRSRRRKTLRCMSFVQRSTVP